MGALHMDVSHMKKFRTYYKSKIGWLEIVGTSEAITGVNFTDTKQDSDRKIPEILKECRTQLDEYFRGNRTDFSIRFMYIG